MTVVVLSRVYPYDTADVIGVYSTMPLAEKAASKEPVERWSGWYYAYDVCTLDADPI